MNATVGALEVNAAAVSLWRTRAADAGAHLLITPELALTGYPPEDLLLKEGFLRAAGQRLDALIAETSPTALAVGTVVHNDFPGVELAPRTDTRRSPAGLANAIVVASGGELLGVTTKRHLPNYDVFDERRYFQPGVGAVSLTTIQGVKIGFLVCEDIWVDEGPARDVAAAGAQVIVVANASPYARGRRAEREALLVRRARETGCVLVYVNLVGGQDELVFDGQSVVIVPGAQGVVARACAFGEELLIVDIESTGEDGASLVVTGVVADLLEPAAEVYEALVTGTRDYLAKNGFSSAILGLSGGVDSAIVATIATDAIGADRVSAFAMPSRYSSHHSLSDAELLAASLGIQLTTLPIEATHSALAATLTPVLTTEPVGLTDENLQSRIRGVLLMALSNATGAIVLTTGNKSEMATGYSTLYGDSAGGFAVIKDVPKTLVYQLCEWRNQLAALRGETPPIPRNILDKAPSAELRPDQRDDQSLPPYDELDPLLEAYVEGDATANELIARGHDADLVRRIVQLVDRSEYKRRQMPPGVRITRKAFGKDRRLPITNGFRETT
jgi:NAD+ synthase (glutamine-hydrolysing)